MSWRTGDIKLWLAYLLLSLRVPLDQNRQHSVCCLWRILFNPFSFSHAFAFFLPGDRIFCSALLLQYVPDSGSSLVLTPKSSYLRRSPADATIRPRDRTIRPDSRGKYPEVENKNSVSTVIIIVLTQMVSREPTPTGFPRPKSSD